MIYAIFIEARSLRNATRSLKQAIGVLFWKFAYFVEKRAVSSNTEDLSSPFHRKFGKFLPNYMVLQYLDIFLPSIKAKQYIF